MGLFRRNKAEPVVSEPPVVREPAVVVEARSNIPRVTRQRPIRVPARRAFEASQTDRLNASWSTEPVSADDLVLRHQRVLVARSRAEALSNDYLKGFIQKARQNLIGPRGIILQAQARDRATGPLDEVANRTLEAWWREWGRPDSCDVTTRRGWRKFQKALVTSLVRDGEYMAREIVGRSAGPHGYSLQLLDPQRCPVDFCDDRPAGDGRFIMNGIEFTREGRPLAYYFRSKSASPGAYNYSRSGLERVPADQIIHGFVEDVPGQRRGFPWVATALWRLHNLGAYERATLTNARISASLQGFLQWRDGEGPDVDEDAEEEEAFFEVEEGAFQELPPGLEVKDLAGQYPTGELGPFQKAMLRGAAAGLGISYVNFANDLEGVNFSSIRQGVLDERDHWIDVQEDLIEDVDRIYRGALRQALLRGMVTLDGVTLRPERVAKYEAVHWQARRWAWVDPLKDVQSETLMMSNLLVAPSDVIRRRGEDPETVWRSIGSDINAMQAAGIPDAMIQSVLLGGAGGAAGGAPPPGGEGDADGEEGGAAAVEDGEEADDGED